MPLLPVVAAGAAAVVLVAPAAFLLLPTDSLSAERDAHPSSIAVYSSVRVMGDTSQVGAYSVSVELLRRGMFGELRVAEWRLPEALMYQTIRVGRVVRRSKRMQGGVPLGYQRTSRDVAQDGVEVGFPLAFLGSSSEIRLEPSYVLRPSGGIVNYRLRWARRLARLPLHAGLDFELKRLREPTPFASALSAQLLFRP